MADSASGTNHWAGYSTVSVEIAEAAAQLRATQNLRTPDSIQIATALQANARFFLTNDARLAAVPNVDVLVLDDLLTNV